MMSIQEEATAVKIGLAVATRYGALATGCCSLSCGAALDLAALREGERLVDLGCGRGSDLVRASEQVGPEGSVTGVDATPLMLEAARERTADAVNVAVVEGDLAATTLTAGCADAVISNCAINHAPDKGAVYREVARLLVPGGRVVVSDVVSEGILPAAVRADPAAWAACYGGAIPEGEYLAAITSAGLVDLEILSRSDPYEKGGVLVRSLTVRARAPRPASES